MANQLIDQTNEKQDSTLDSTLDELNEIENFFGLPDPDIPATESEERRQAIHAIVNIAIFILLWVGTSIAALMTGYNWYVKTALVLIAFPVWGFFINKFVIGWTSPIAGSRKES